MKLNIKKLQEGGNILPNVTVTANKLRFISPQEKSRFDLIKDTQGDKTALNWLKVKQGTTAGINAFAEDPRTQAVMMLVPMPGGFEGFNGVFSKTSNLKNTSNIAKEISSNSTMAAPFDLHNAIRGAKEFYDNDVQWRFAAKRTYPNVNWDSLDDAERQSLNKNIEQVKQYYRRPEPVVRFEKNQPNSSDLISGYYEPRSNEIVVTDLSSDPVSTIIHEHTHQQQHLLNRINPNRVSGYTPDEVKLLDDAYKTTRPLELSEKGATNRQLRYILSDGKRGPDLDKHLNNLGRWDIAQHLFGTNAYSEDVLDYILHLPSDAHKNTAIEKIRTALKFVPGIAGVSTIQSKQTGGTINNNFNTPIPNNMLSKYKDWYNKLPKNLQETNDYDLQGAFLDNQVTHSNHLTDKFKKPNHPTFSNESIYSKSNSSGKWKDNMFIIPNRNINRLEEIRKYLKGSDPTTYPVFNGGVVLPEVIIHGK